MAVPQLRNFIVNYPKLGSGPRAANLSLIKKDFFELAQLSAGAIGSMQFNASFNVQASLKKNAKQKDLVIDAARKFTKAGAAMAYNDVVSDVPVGETKRKYSQRLNTLSKGYGRGKKGGKGRNKLRPPMLFRTEQYINLLNRIGRSDLRSARRYAKTSRLNLRSITKKRQDSVRQFINRYNPRVVAGYARGNPINRNYITVYHAGGTLKSTLSYFIRNKFKQNAGSTFKYPRFVGATLAHNYNSSIYYYVFPYFGLRQQRKAWFQKNLAPVETKYVDQSLAHIKNLLRQKEFSRVSV